jgi:putative spermidine/putrescine transport system ATP-binding protein
VTSELRLVGLGRRYPGSAKPALDSLDLTVSAGSCVVLVGPSGSGKSTALRLVAGLDRPDAGDVLVDGLSVLRHAPERRGMAMVFQRPSLFPHLSVLDNVAFAARMRGASRREARGVAARYLTLVHLSELADRSTCTLSGGQAQRVALARALAAEPAVLLLDEPFSALDPALTDEMHDLLEELRVIVGPTILMVTHDQAEAARLGDTVAVVMSGALLQHATPADLYSRPTSVEVHRFLGGLVEIPGEVRGGCHISALGHWALPEETACADGPATLLVRHESAVLLAPDDPAADATGVVAASRVRGVRALVEVATPGGSLYVECPAAAAPRPGTPVGVHVPVHARAAVPQSLASTGAGVRAG